MSSGQKLDLTFKLELGAPSETVTVTSQAPQLNTVNAEQDINIGNVQVAELPVAKRDVTSLLNLGTGMNSGGDSVSVNGLPPRGFTFSVDGVNAAPDSEYASVAMYQNFNYIKGVSMEAVKEVEVSKNVFSAEIGKSVSGNVNIITKGGTNQFHGSAFEQYQSGGLNAVNHFTSIKSPLVLHQFGGSFGGPIIRDKIFFYGAYEGYRYNGKSAISGLVPTVGIRQQVTAVLPAAKGYFDLWPLPTASEKPGDVTALFAGIATETRDENHAVIRGDFNISSGNFLSTRYTRSRPNYLQPRLAIGNPRIRGGISENGSATYTRVWSPKMTSEIRFGYNLADLSRMDKQWDLAVGSISGGGLSTSSAELFLKGGSTATLDSSFVLSRSRHSIKFGGTLEWVRTGRTNAQVPEYSYASIADLLKNDAASARFVLGVGPFHIRTMNFGFFFQDDYRLRTNLTVNFGIRYDYFAVPDEEDGHLYNRDGPFGPYRSPDSPWDARYLNFSPRLGFAWTVDKKTVVRGGFGVFYIPFNFMGGPVEIVKNGVNIPNEATFAGSQLKALGIKYPDANDTVRPVVQASNIISDSSIDPHWKNSYSMQWSFGIQRQLTESLVWEISHVGNRGVKLTYSPVLNRVDILTGLVGNAKFSQFRYYNSGDSSVYHSLQTSLKKRFSKNLMFDVNYTYASNLSYFLGDYNCCGAGDNPQDLNDLKSNRGSTPYHIRHRFLGDWVYELPLGDWFRTQQWPALFKGWQLGGILQAQTGTPLTFSQGNATNTPGARPDFVGTSYGSAIYENWSAAHSDGTYWFLNPAAFAKVPINNTSKALIRPGNMGRNAMHGPGRWTVDMSLSKSIRIAEAKRIQLRADLFNAMNRTNLNNPVVDANNTRFGQITGSGSGRQTQLSLRFDF